MTLAAALMAWLWTGVASAQLSSPARPRQVTFDAPRCDDRGAITFGELPVLQPLEHSLESPADADQGCLGSVDADVCQQDGSHHVPKAPSSTEPTQQAAGWQLELDVSYSGSLPRARALGDARSAHTASLERPPRA